MEFEFSGLSPSKTIQNPLTASFLGRLSVRMDVVSSRLLLPAKAVDIATYHSSFYSPPPTEA